MVRTALWLVSEIGVGGVFTKQMHRAAFSNVVQADRRLRDLRKFGWVIHTHREDGSLNANEQRLVSIGERIWEPGIARHLRSTSISRKERINTLRSRDYRCESCGVGPGERYPDALHLNAVLGVFDSGRTPSAEGKRELVVWCRLCREQK
jgi:hypothetical protein